jgi:cytochrome o ubiquinol oxidase subunit 1
VIDAYWSSKQRTRGIPDLSPPTRAYQPIEVPKNSAVGFVTAFFAVVIGFSLIWHIWWLVVLGLFGVFTTLLIFAFRDGEEIEISAEQIARFERHAQTGVA